jgi:hypothetical protein
LLTIPDARAAEVDEGRPGLVHRIHDVLRFEVALDDSSSMALDQNLATSPQDWVS